MTYHKKKLTKTYTKLVHKKRALEIHLKKKFQKKSDNLGLYLTQRDSGGENSIVLSDASHSSQYMTYICYRSCMNKLTKCLYDEKMKQKGNASIQDIIDANVKMYGSDNIRFDECFEKTMVKKKFGLKSVAPMISDINPILNIRMADFLFPLDSSCQYMPKQQSLFHELDTIKRAIKQEYDPKECLTSISLEERYISDEKLKGAQNLKYFIEWQRSLGDYRAKNFSEKIENYMKNLFKAKVQVNLQPQLADCTHKKNKNEKFYLKKLTEQTWEYIKAQPYFVRFTSTDIHTKKGTFNIIQFSDKIVKLFGKEKQKLSDFNSISNKCDKTIFHHQKTKSWIETFSCMYNMDDQNNNVMFLNNPYWTFPKDCFYLEDHLGNKIDGQFRLFRESYEQNGVIRYLTIFVLGEYFSHH